MSDLDKIARCLSGDQFVAGLKHCQRTLARHPDRVSVLGFKSILEILSHDYDAACQTTDRLLKVAPESPVGLGQRVLLRTQKQSPREAVDAMQDALRCVGEEWPPIFVEALTAVAITLLREDECFAALAHALLVLQEAGTEADERAGKLLAQIYRGRGYHPLVKMHWAYASCPGEADWKSDFDAAVADARSGLWREAKQKFAALIGPSRDHPSVRKNLAIVRGNLAETATMVQALYKYAAQDVPLDDAVEAAALALLLDPKRKNDLISLLSITYEIEDPEAALVQLPGHARLKETTSTPEASHPDEGPVARGNFLVFDRPAPEPAEGLTIEDIPRKIGLAQIFARETDRPPRLQIFAAEGSQSELCETILREALGEQMGTRTKSETIGAIDRFDDLCNWEWELPPGLDIEQLARLVEERVRLYMFHHWPDEPWAALGGKTVRQIAQQPDGQVLALGAILAAQEGGEFNRKIADVNELRRQLGLPTADPIPPSELPADPVPAPRLARVVASELSDERLLDLFQQAVSLSYWPAVRNLGPELLRREHLHDGIPPQKICELLAHAEIDLDAGLRHAERGRELALAAGESPARWYLIELDLNYQLGHGDEVGRLFEILQKKYLNEPGVSERLFQFMYRAGVIDEQGNLAAHLEESSGLIVPEGAGDQPGKIWTPEETPPASESSAPSKLWMPD